MSVHTDVHRPYEVVMTVCVPYVYVSMYVCVCLEVRTQNLVNRSFLSSRMARNVSFRSGSASARRARHVCFHTSAFNLA